MDSYKIKLILIAINVLIYINNNHADELKECIDSLIQIGYNNTFIVLNFFEFTNRIIFVNGGIKHFEKSIKKKKDKCLLKTPVPNYARACSELNNAQRYLFMESDNNWAYRYECAMLIKIYENELMNAEQWCNEFAVKETDIDVLINDYHNGIRYEELVNKIISTCTVELHAHGLIFKNGINNYMFLNIEFNYHTFYKNYLIRHKSKSNKILNAIEWCAENAANTGTFIEKKKTFLNDLPDIYKNNINTTLVNICTAVLQTKGFTRTKNAYSANEKKYYLKKYKAYMSTSYVFEVTGALSMLRWCEQNLKTDLKVTAEQQLVPV